MPTRKMPQFAYQPYQENYYNQPFQPSPQSYYPPTAFSKIPQQQVQTIPPYQYFAKPTQPAEWYPDSTIYGNSNPQQAKGFMAMFQDKNGQMDLDKMLSTVGQMANTYQQVSPIIKGIGSFMKGVK